MVDTPERFREGATVYRNARDWAKDQRDEAITQSNERACDSQRTTLAIETNFEQSYSFVYESGLDGRDVTSPASQESRISPPSPDLDSTISSHNSAVLSGESSLNTGTQPAKRLNSHSLHQSPPQRKRQNAGGSDGDGQTR
jgi:hypothetical protein